MKELVLALSGLLLATSTYAASFDCAKAQTAYEKLVCNDFSLGMSDIAMSDRYHQALALTPHAAKKEIVLSQKNWLASITKALDDKAAQSISNNEIKKWLGGALRARVAELYTQVIVGKPVIMNDQPSSKDVCSAVLSDKNIAKASDVQSSDQGEAPTPSDDEYILSLPNQFSSPNWDQGHARFDFENQGKPVDVYLVSIEATHIVGQFYIVANPEEKHAIEEKLGDATGVNDKLDLASDFALIGAKSNKVDHPPKFASKLFDPSLSSAYGKAAYTRSQVFQFGNSTYLLATATNRFSPTFVVFKPKATTLDPICYYWIRPNIQK